MTNRQSNEKDPSKEALSKAAHTMRTSESHEERSKAASVMGQAGGHQSHGGHSADSSNRKKDREEE